MPDNTAPATTPDRAEGIPRITVDEEKELKSWDPDHLESALKDTAAGRIARGEEVLPYTSPSGDAAFEDRVNKITFGYLSEHSADPFQALRTVYNHTDVGNITSKDAQNTYSAADPVNLFNGNFVYTSTDAEINGAGMDFVFVRAYSQLSHYNGPLGHKWDHQYNLWLRVEDGAKTLRRSSGSLREEIYRKHEQHDYWIPPDGTLGIILEKGNSFILRLHNGSKVIYKPHQTLHPSIHVVARIEDRFGNHLDFLYLDGRLVRVRINHPDRIVEFQYDTLDRLISIHDFSGRVWRYEYDDLGDLVATRTPVTSQYKNGLTTRYEYTSSLTSDPYLQHNLVAIIDSDGRIYLENEFGTERNLLSYRRVVRQRHGSGDIIFDYADVIEDFDFPYEGHERPTHQTIVTERDGRQIRHLFNRFGNMIFKEEFVRINGLPKLVASHYRYNRDSNLVGVISPLGVITQALYGRDFYERRFPPDAGTLQETDPNLTQEVRLQFDNLLAVVRRGKYHDVNSLALAGGLWSAGIFPDIMQANDQDLIHKFTYEPDFAQLLTVSDPRFTGSADPVFVEDAEYHRRLTRYSYAAGSGFQHLFLESIELPTPLLPDGTLSDVVKTSFPEYDENGRILRIVGANGLETINTYFQQVDGTVAGFLKTSTIDPGGLDITTGMDRDQLGRIVKAFRPHFFDFYDDRFFSASEYNELGQVVRTTTTAPFSIDNHYSYDRAGNITRTITDLKDHTNFRVGSFEMNNRYDDELNRISQKVGNAEDGGIKQMKVVFDQASRPLLSFAPSGRKRKTRYNERSLLSQVIEDYGGVNAATRYHYDADGRLVKIIGPRGFPTTFAFDTHGRPVELEDAKGNRSLRRYDKLGNLLVDCLYERIGQDAFILRSRREFSYDELGRLIGASVNKFEQSATIPEDHLQEAFGESGPGDLVTSKFYYDTVGNLVKQVDHNGREFLAEFDLAGRVTKERDAHGNELRYSYDKEGNLLRIDRQEATRDLVTNSVTGTRHFAEQFAYDELNRLVERTTSVGSTRYRYDSRDNCVEVQDALGNKIENLFDIFSRLTGTLQLLHRHQTGDVPAPLRVTFFYDLDDKIIAQTDALGRTTQFRYDSAGRLTGTVLPDGSSDAIKYDRAGNITELRDRNALITKAAWDELNMNTGLLIDGSAVIGEGISAGPTAYSAEYDALGRFKVVENDFVVNRFTFNSLSHLIGESTSFTAITGVNPANQYAIQREFSSTGALMGVTYPAGRVIRYARDVLDRVIAVEQIKKGNDYPGNPAFPERLVIAEIQYEGLQIKRISRNNGISTEFKYDFAGRMVEITHTKAENTILILQFLYDALGNVRQKLELSNDFQSTQGFKYDSLSRLFEIRTSATAALIDVSLIAPPSIPLPEELPNRQSQIDQLASVLLAQQQARVYDYDLAGNRLSKISEGVTEDYKTNDLDQYSRVNNLSLRWDNNGNLVEDEAFRYWYDNRNQISRLKKADFTELRIFRDYFGRACLQTDGQENVLFIYDESDLLEQYEADQLRRSVLSNVGQGGVLLSSSSGREFYLLSDQNGSVRYLFDGDQRHNFYVYDEFGGLTNFLISSDDNPFRFAGKRLLGDTRKYDFLFRTYDPSIGRFIQRDTKGFVDGTNLYSFLRNNPLGFSDLWGLESRSEHGPKLNDSNLDEALSVRTDIDCSRLDCIAFLQGAFNGELKWAGAFVPTEFEKELPRHNGMGHNYYPITVKGAIGIGGLVGWRIMDIEDSGGDGNLYHDVTREGEQVGNSVWVSGSGSMEPGFGASMLDPSQLLVGKITPWFREGIAGGVGWLRTAIARSGVKRFGFGAIAQDAKLLAHWNQALRNLAADTESTYARTLGQQLAGDDARAVFNEVNQEFFKLLGIKGLGKYNTHHWNNLAQFPELFLDPRNLFLVGSAINQGKRVGEHIFLHWMTRSGNPYTGLLRPGAVLYLGEPRSVLRALLDGYLSTD